MFLLIHVQNKAIFWRQHRKVQTTLLPLNEYVFIQNPYSWELWRIWIENSSVSVIFHSIFVVLLPGLLSGRLYFLPQTWPAQCDCELKSSGILDTHLYSIYCSTKIYDFSSKFPSEAAWPFWRQREQPICPGSAESPDVKSSSSVLRASSFVSSRKSEILWRILLSRKTQELVGVFFLYFCIIYFCIYEHFPTVSPKAKAKDELK